MHPASDPIDPIRPFMLYDALLGLGGEGSDLQGCIRLLGWSSGWFGSTSTTRRRLRRRSEVATLVAETLQFETRTEVYLSKTDRRI